MALVEVEGRQKKEAVEVEGRQKKEVGEVVVRQKKEVGEVVVRHRVKVKEEVVVEVGPPQTMEHEAPVSADWEEEVEVVSQLHCVPAVAAAEEQDLKTEALPMGSLEEVVVARQSWEVLLSFQQILERFVETIAKEHG